MLHTFPCHLQGKQTPKPSPDTWPQKNSMLLCGSFSSWLQAFSQSFFSIPSYSLFKLMIIFPHFSTSFGQLLGCFSPGFMITFTSLQLMISRPSSQEREWQIFGSSMSPFSPWTIIVTFQSSSAQQQHLSFVFVSIQGPLKQTNSLKLGSSIFLNSQSVPRCVICPKKHFLCTRMSSNAESFIFITWYKGSYKHTHHLHRGNKNVS